ncbi:hypothetical protein LRD18_12730 [Halorhodospira halochloris]|uniref:hypothetical protein n=1 Tax=Halorhodospira halochloris TaxID=1052 RepID=UPI001EE79EA6|nr:hypothetical protein [Halorhodospira halochloris]MCG5531702.1 hypothetical protein [Halorhodospira halochloris]
MALSNAERQRRYRQRRKNAHSGEGYQRINTWISTSAFIALQRLAAYKGVSSGRC